MTTELERASAPERALQEAADAGKVKMGDLLKAVGIDANNPAHQAALMACAKYELDPLLKHVIVIKGNVYVTTDGYRFHAEQTGQHNGTVVVEAGETPSHWTATVAVYRKGIDHPFTFPGRYPKAGTNKQYGIEMAIVRAERNALARAFPIAGVQAEPTQDREPDTSATVKVIDELDAVNRYVEEFGDPAELADDAAEAELINDDGTLDLGGAA